MGKVKRKINVIALVSVESKSLDSIEVRVEGWLPEAGQSNRERWVENGRWKDLKLGGSSDKLIHNYGIARCCTVQKQRRILKVCLWGLCLVFQYVAQANFDLLWTLPTSDSFVLEKQVCRHS